MRQCAHHVAYEGSNVDCKLYGVGPIARCQGCIDFDRVKRKSRGLGDTISNALATVGVTPASVSAATGQPCNCPKYIAALNELVSYKQQEENA